MITPAAGSEAAKRSRTLKRWYDEKFKNPWEDSTVNRWRWKTGVEGKILLSDDPGKTISFNSEGHAEKQWNETGNDRFAPELKKMLLEVK